MITLHFKEMIFPLVTQWLCHKGADNSLHLAGLYSRDLDVSACFNYGG